MTNKVILDFECPQFVDFDTELDSSSKDDMFFDCKDHQSPENENVYKTPANVNAVTVKYPKEEDEDRLLDKMTAALSIIEKTPKLKMGAVKGKLLAEAFSRNFCSQVNPNLKPNPAALTAPNLHRSKSIARLNKILTEVPNKARGLHRRSSSLNDLRPYKKQTFPMTPMCLKRTILKTKIKAKTTEEMELEEIAKLQKQLRQHLRFNELSLKRLKLKPRPYVNLKNTHAKTENLKENKGWNPFMQKMNVAEKEPRRNIHTLNHAALKNEAMKIDNIIKSHSTANKVTDKEQKDENARKSKFPPASSTGNAEVNEKKNQITRKTIFNKKSGFHSGLVFHDNIKKSTSVQPFSFDAKIRERVESAGSARKAEVSLSNSTLKCKIDGKENIPYNKAQTTVKKTRGIQNSKCDIVKQLAANKKIVDKCVKNPVKGFPLSENFARN